MASIVPHTAPEKRLRSLVGSFNKSMGEYERGDVTATLQSFKPLEMCDPGSGLLPGCAHHALCANALVRGLQHNKPLRDMNMAALDAALVHRGVRHTARTNAAKVKLLAPIFAVEHYRLGRTTRVQQIVEKFAKRSIIPVILHIFATLRDPNSTIAGLCVDHRVNLAPVQCSADEINRVVARQALVLSELEQAEQALRRGRATAQRVDLARTVLDKRRVAKRLEDISAIIREAPIPVCANSDGDSDVDDTTTAAASKRRLLPLAIKMAQEYRPPADRPSGEVITSHDFFSPLFKKGLYFLFLCFHKTDNTPVLRVLVSSGFFGPLLFFAFSEPTAGRGGLPRRQAFIHTLLRRAHRAPTRRSADFGWFPAQNRSPHWCSRQERDQRQRRRQAGTHRKLPKEDEKARSHWHKHS